MVSVFTYVYGQCMVSMDIYGNPVMHILYFIYDNFAIMHIKTEVSGKKRTISMNEFLSHFITFYANQC